MHKTVIITGATGTLGSRLLDYHTRQDDIVFALSRCDHKIAHERGKYDKVFWCLGDIRNNLEGILPNKADIVYHCAASKHVDAGEWYPSQYHAVNYQGTINVFNHVDCEKFVFFSTDKAVLPVNFYGLTKALAEKHLIAIKKACGKNIQVFRWGNIIGSQGSVIHNFMKQLETGVVNITHMDMTRFWLKIEDAVQFVTGGDHDPKEDILIHPNTKSARLIDLLHAVAQCMGISPADYRCQFIGIRPGEKIHEHLKSDHHSCIRSDTAERYTDDELLGLVGPTVSEYLAQKR